MKYTSRAIVSAVTIAAMGIGSAAQAQQWQPANGAHAHSGQGQAPARQRQAQPAQRWQGQRQWQGVQHAQNWQGQRWQGQRWAPSYGAANRAYDRGYARSYDRGSRYYAAPNYYYGGPRYAVGGYVPYAFRAHRYWVNDWRAYNLAPPPYGYTWVETDSGDFLLMALATGLIASAILGQ